MKLTKKFLTTALLGVSIFSFQSIAWADTPEQQLQQGLTAYSQRDYQTAFKLLLPLAEQGYASAQFNLGVMYASGQGVKQVDEHAKEWLGKACDNGEQEGCDTYRELNQGAK